MSGKDVEEHLLQFKENAEAGPRGLKACNRCLTSVRVKTAPGRSQPERVMCIFPWSSQLSFLGRR